MRSSSLIRPTDENAFLEAMLFLSELAEYFRLVESIFTAPEGGSLEYLHALCFTILSSEPDQRFSSKIPKKLPERFTYLSVSYDNEKLTYICLQQNFMNDMEGTALRVQQLLTYARNTMNPLLKPYFQRQAAYYFPEDELYGPEEEKTQPSNPMTTQYKKLMKLTKILEEIAPFLLYSPEASVAQIYEILEEEKFASDNSMLWQKLALRLFVGRDLIGRDKKFHPHMESVLRLIADTTITCKQAMHNKGHSPSLFKPKSTTASLWLKVTEAEFDLIMEKRNAVRLLKNEEEKTANSNVNFQP